MSRSPTTNAGRGHERRRRRDGEETRQRVLDAAVECILERGYYETSSNLIAQRAGVTWGALQYQFGTRDAILIEVLNARFRLLEDAVASTKIDTDASLEERLEQLLQVLGGYYGVPEHLAQIQILLDLSYNPNTSAEIRAAVAEHSRQLSRCWRPLVHATLGEAGRDADLMRYTFTTLRGYLVGQIISAHVSTAPPDRLQRKMLVRGVAAALREEAASKGLTID